MAFESCLAIRRRCDRSFLSAARLLENLGPHSASLTTTAVAAHSHPAPFSGMHVHVGPRRLWRQPRLSAFSFRSFRSNCRTRIILLCGVDGVWRNRRSHFTVFYVLR